MINVKYVCTCELISGKYITSEFINGMCVGSDLISGKYITSAVVMNLVNHYRFPFSLFDQHNYFKIQMYIEILFSFLLFNLTLSFPLTNGRKRLYFFTS